MKKITIVLSLISIAGLSAFAQENSSEMSFGALKTEAEKSAVKYGIKHLADVNAAEILAAMKESALYLKPYASLEAGEEDVFQNGSAGLRGFYMPLDRDQPTKTQWIFPYSVGIEGSRNLESYAGIAEAGITTPFRPLGVIPWSNEDVVLGKNVKIGLFGQIGYKFQDSTNAADVGTGLENDSDEKEGDNLGRIKLDGSISLLVVKITGAGSLSVKGSATVWYDVVNEEFYNREEARIRLTPDFWKKFLDGKHVDFSYEHGSGAPTFNKGEQYGLSLTMEF